LLGAALLVHRRLAVISLAAALADTFQEYEENGLAVA
jgi:hypothetical protein